DTINNAARELAATTSLGTQEARDALATLASAPGFVRTQQNMVATAKTAQDVAAAFHESLADAAKDITSIFSDPIAASMKYAHADIKSFDDAFQRHIQNLVNNGQKAQAVNEVYNRLATTVQ